MDEMNSFVPMTPPNHFVKELRGVLDQQNILSAKTKQKGKNKITLKLPLIVGLQIVLLLYNSIARLRSTYL